MAESALSFEIDGKTYAIEDFELGELEWLEDELGGSLDEINASSMKAATRFVYLVKKRDDPDFTLDDARKLKLSVLQAPDEPAGNGTGKKPSRPTAAPKG